MQQEDERKKFVCLCVCSPPRHGGSVPSGSRFAYRLQSDGLVHAGPRARPRIQLTVLDAERNASTQQHLRRAEPQHPECHRAQPERLPAAVRRQPGVPRGPRTRSGWDLSLRGQ